MKIFGSRLILKLTLAVFLSLHLDAIETLIINIEVERAKFKQHIFHKIIAHYGSKYDWTSLTSAHQRSQRTTIGSISEHEVNSQYSPIRDSIRYIPLVEGWQTLDTLYMFSIPGCFNRRDAYLYCYKFEEVDAIIDYSHRFQEDAPLGEFVKGLADSRGTLLSHGGRVEKIKTKSGLDGYLLFSHREQTLDLDLKRGQIFNAFYIIELEYSHLLLEIWIHKRAKHLVTEIDKMLLETLDKYDATN